ncbi:hypothetical protein ACOSQ4_010217 [Xanthoceras sorbifolium]
MAVVWWRSWYRRNRLIHGHDCFPLDQASRPPEVAVYKINTDVAISVADNCVGLDVVIRSCCGAAMLSTLKRLPSSFSPAVVEARAILYGMQLASNSGLLPLVVE